MICKYVISHKELQHLQLSSSCGVGEGESWNKSLWNQEVSSRSDSKKETTGCRADLTCPPRFQPKQIQSQLNLSVGLFVRLQQSLRLDSSPEYFLID